MKIVHLNENIKMRRKVPFAAFKDISLTRAQTSRKFKKVRETHNVDADRAYE